MAVALVQVSLAAETGLPEDAMVNTFHFEGGTMVDPENVFDMIEDFYTVVPSSGTSAVQDLFSTDAYGNTATVKMYNLEDPQPRIPFLEDTFTLTPSSGDGLPSEVALVLSFQAEPESGTPQARRRNRIYLGGIVASQNVNQRPSSSGRLTIARSAEEMLNASNASVNWTWVVYSPTIAAGSGPGGAFAPVVGGWIDDAWDTQRRRGLAPTTRQVFPTT